MGREMGGSFRREGIYVHLWLIHVETWQKTTKFCKAIILQLKYILKKWPPSKDLQAVGHSQQTECWETYIPTMNKRQEKSVFQASIYQQLSTFYDVRTHLHRGPHFLSHREYVSLHFLSLVNLFLGDTRTAHEETDYKRMSECRVPYCCCQQRENANFANMV